MTMPIVRAASSTFVPAGTSTGMSSMISFGMVPLVWGSPLLRRTDSGTLAGQFVLVHPLVCQLEHLGQLPPRRCRGHPEGNAQTAVAVEGGGQGLVIPDPVDHPRRIGEIGTGQDDREL